MLRVLAAVLTALLLVVPGASAQDPSTTMTTVDAPNVADEPLPDEEEDAGSTWLLVLMAIIVAVMVVVAAAFVRGRRPPD